MSLPEVTTREEWLAARREFLVREKQLTRQRDALNADRRRLPMVRVEKAYTFEGPNGPLALADLFDGRRQLIVQHVMFGPDWDAPCPGCTSGIVEISPGILTHLASRETTFVLVSRAPYDKIAAAAAERGWFIPWYSSYDSDFNYDFGVTLDSGRGLIDYNYRPEPDLLGDDTTTEVSGYSSFLRDGAEVYHTYSTYARGLDAATGAYPLLDLTALGRQEDWEEPKGRSGATRGGDPTFRS